MKNRILLLLCFCLSAIWTTHVYASHIEAADLTFHCIGPHQYQITLTAYRDCNGIAMPSTLNVHYSSVTCGVSDSITLTEQAGTGIDVTDTCPGHHSACHGGSGYGVQQYIYTAILNLPANCGADWILSWQSCCRNTAITTINNPGNTGLYLQATLNNTLSHCDNSPTFLNYPTAFLCLGQVNQINQGGYDADGDSVTYQLVNSMSNSSTPVTYIGGVNATDPLHVTGNFGFDPTTGQITIVPSQSQVGVVKILVNEYRGGVLIGQVERDLQLVVQVCTDSLPRTSGTNGPSSSDTTFTIPACTASCFTIYSSTPSTDPTVALTLSVTGQSAFPGATFTISSGQFPTLTFCWTPTRSSAGTHTFYLTVKDNACPNPGSSTRGYTLIVPETYPAGGDQTICQYSTVTTAATGTGTWSVIPGNATATTFGNATSAVTTITGFTLPGRNNYVWTTTNGCTDTMSIFITAKPNAGSDQTICQFTSTNMTATGNGTWTALPSNPAVTSFANQYGPTTVVSGFTAGGVYYFLWTSNSCSDTVKITVTPKPNAGLDQIACTGSGTVTMAATGTGTWTAAAANITTATFANPTSPTTIVSGLDSSATYTFYWTSAGCSDTVLVTVNIKPIAGSDQTICQYNSIVMAASGTGTWTALASNPAVLTISNTTSPTTSVTGFTTAGTYYLLWTLNGCSDSVKVTVNAKPNAGIDKTICQYSTLVMTGTGTGTWTAAVANPATTVFSTATSPVTSVTGFTATGVYTYYWTLNGCSDTVLITVNAMPIAGPDQTICQYNSIVMTANGTGTWTTLGSNPAVLTITNAVSPTTAVTGFTAAGTYYLLWSLNGCSDSVKVTVNAKPNAGTDKTICQNSTILMNATGTGTWTAAAANPATTTFSNAASPVTSVTGFTAAGLYAYYWTLNGCSDTVLITVNTAPVAGPDQTICQYNSIVMAASGIGTWTALASNPAVVTIANTASPTTSVTGFTAAGAYYLLWSLNGCSDSVKVTVNAKPNAGTDKTICQHTNIIMNGTGVGTWTAAPSNPEVATITTPASPITSVIGLDSSGIYTFYFSANGCSDTVLITVNAAPKAGPDQTICINNPVVLAATGTGVWTALASNPAVVTFANTTSPTTSVTGFTVAGTYYLLWSLNGCSDSVKVTVNTKPNAGTDKIICQHNSIVMNGTGLGTWTAAASNPEVVTITTATSPTTSVTGFDSSGIYTFYFSANGCSDTVLVTVNASPYAGSDQTACLFNTILMSATGTGTWTALASNPAVAVITNTTSPTTSVSGFSAAGIYTFLWSQSGCSDTVKITVVTKPNAGIDKNICQYNAVAMTATGTGTWSPAAANPVATTIANTTSLTTTISGFTTAGTYIYYWLLNGCSDTVLVNVTAKPVAGPDQTICLPGTITTAATGAGLWTALAGNPAVTTFANSSNPVTTISGFTTGGTYTYLWLQNGCSDTMIVTVVPIAPAGPDQTICQYNSIVAAGFGSGTWAALASNPIVTTIVNPALGSTAITGFTIPGLYGYTWTVNNCKDTMYVQVNAKPDAGTDQTICQYSSALMNATGAGTWTAAAANPAIVTFTSSSSPSTSVSGFNLAGSYALFWSQNGCSDTVIITVTAKPNAGADKTVCQYNTVLMTATGTGTWTVAAANPAIATITSTTSPTTSITGLNVAGLYTFYWSLNGCSDTVTITVNAKPNAGSDQTICQYSSAVMTASGAGIWTSAASNPAATSIANASLPTTTVTGFTLAGIYTFYWSQNGCSDTVLITVSAKPIAGTDKTICQHSGVVMNGSGSGTWTAAATNPEAVTVTTPASPTTSVTGFDSTGSYIFYFSANGCSDTVIITVNTLPYAGTDQTTCLNSTITMNAAGTGTWTALASNPAVTTIVNTTSPVTIVSGFTIAGNYNYLWSLNGCTDTVKITVITKPNAGIDKTICQNNTAAMTATGTGTWTAAAANPALTVITNATSPTTSITGLNTAGTYIYYWSLNGCSDTVNIIVNVKPNAGADQSICLPGTITTTATGTGIWTALASNPAVTTFANSSNAVTTISGFTTGGTYTFLWSLNGCNDTMQVSVVPIAPAGPDQNICQYQSINEAAFGTGTWSALISNPIPTVITNPVQNNTAITGFNMAGTYGYIWTVNNCTDTMYVTVTAKPDAGADQTICQSSVTSFTASGSGTWTAMTGNPATTTITNTTSPTSSVFGFTIAGVYNFIWTVNGCADTVSITAIPKPSAGADQTTCQYDTAIMAATGAGNWTADASNPAVVNIVSPTSPNTTIAGLNTPGAYIFYWSLNACSDTVVVTVNAKPNAGLDQTICQNSTTTLAATGTGIWSAAAGNPSVVAFANNTLPTSTVSGFTVGGLYNLLWINNGCSDTITINAITKPHAGADKTICQYSAVVMTATGTGTWTAEAANPAVTAIANTTSPTTAVTGLNIAGIYSYYWSLNGCTDTVNVNVTAKPYAGNDQITCQYSSVTMTATGSGVWSTLSSNPVATTITAATSPTTAISGFSIAGSYGYIWHVSGCTDTVYVTVTAKPDAGTDQIICQYSFSTVMTASGIGTWTALSTNPEASNIISPAQANTTITGFDSLGIYGYVWTVNGCSDTVNVTVNAKPNAGTDQTICQYSTASMSATGTGAWSIPTGNPATVTFANTSSATSSVSGFSVPSAYTLIWTTNSCSDSVTINVTLKPDAGSDQTVCQYNTVALSATGVGTWTAAAANPAATVIANTTSPTTGIDGFGVAGTYSFYWTNNSCPDTVLIHVTAKPDAGADQTICQYSTAVMTATGTGTWSSSATNPSPLTFANAASPLTSVSGFNTAGSYALYWTKNGCSDTVVITVTTKPDAGSDQGICQYSGVTMAATGIGTWTAEASNPSVTTINNPISPITTINGFSLIGTYYYYWTNSGCSDTAKVAVTAKPDAGTDQTICQYSTTSLNATGSGSWSSAPGNPAAVTFASIASPVSSVSGFSAAGVYVLYWTHTGCSDTVQITVTPKPDAGADQSICLPGNITTTATGAGTWTALSSNPGVTTFANTNTPVTTISGFTAGGTYSYLWTLNGCSDTMSISVVPVAPAGPDQTICQYESITEAAFGTGSWAALNSNPAVTTFANASNGSTVITGFSAAGTYGYIWSVNNCTDTMYVTVIAKPDAGTDQTVCQYNTVGMAATGAGTWTASATNPATTTIASTTLPTTSITGFDIAGTYTFYWSNNGCSDTIQIQVTAKPAAGTDQTICQYSTTAMTATGSGTWTTLASNPIAITFSNSNSPASLVSGFSLPGIYTFLWTLNSCSDTVNIFVTPKPDAGADQTICQYSTTLLSATGAGTWSALPGNPATESFANNTSPTSIVSGFTVAGVYSLLWTENSCSDTVVIIVTSKPDAGTDQIICQYSTTAMTAFGAGVWTSLPGNPAIIAFTDTVSPFSDVSGFSVPGIYSFVWSNNGCSDTATITVNAKPNAGLDQLIATNTATTFSATPIITSGLWYEFTNNPVTVNIIDPSSSNTPVSGFSVSGLYGFGWSVNGCPDSMYVDVMNPPNAGDDTTICAYKNIILHGSGNGTWTQLASNPKVVNISDTASLTPLLTGFTLAGKYYFVLSYAGLNPDTVIVSVDPLPVITITEHDAICTQPSGSVVASASGSTGPYQYLWNNNSTSDSVGSFYFNTYYAVTVTDANGCISTDTGRIQTTRSSLSIVADSVTQISCHGLTDGAVYIPVVPTYTYQWSNNTSSAVLSAAGSGTYTVTVYDPTGCTGTATYIIVDPPAASLTILPQDSTLTEGTSVTFTSLFAPFADSAIVSYNWSPSIGLSCANCPNPVFTSSAGQYQYSLLVTYNNGCIISDTVNLKVISQHLVYVPNAFTPNGDGINDLYQAYAKGIRYFNMQIFDRWGEKVYESEDDGAGWNGTYKGVQMSPGVYTYTVTVSFDDHYTANLKGSLTLIR